MKSAVDVDDAAVQQMVEESVEHAFEDLAARRWIEARLKATELVSATKKGLADCAGEISENERVGIEQALAEVEKTLTAAGGNSGTGDVKALNGACTALDEATRPMADLLMDRAMTAMLRKRGLIQ